MDNSKLSLLFDLSGPPVSDDVCERGFAAQNLRAPFCLTIPMRRLAPQHNPAGQPTLLGFVGINLRSFPSDSSFDHYQRLVNEFNSLHDRVRCDQLAMLIDDILNRESLSGLSSAGTEVLETFTDQLTEVLRRGFRAACVEVWIRGMICPQSCTISPEIEKILAGQVEMGTRSGGVAGNYDYHSIL